MKNDFALFCTFIPFAYWYLIPAMLKYFLFPDYFDDLIIDKALFFTFFIIFLSYSLCNIIILLLKAVSNSQKKTIDFLPETGKNYRLVVFTLPLLIFFIIPIYPGELFQSLLNIKTLAVRAVLVESGLLNNKLGTVNKFFTALLGYINIFIGVFFILYGGHKSIKSRKYIFYGAIILAITVLITGTRSYSFFLIIALWFMLHFNKIKINKVVLLFLALSFFSLIAMFGTARGGYEEEDDVTFVDSALPLFVTDNNFFDEFLIGARYIEWRGENFGENPVYMFATQFIPRFIWHEKPTSKIVNEITFDRWGLDAEEGYGNILPGIFGQFYMGMGLIGIILLILIIAILSHYLGIVSRKIEQNNNSFENSIYIVLLFVAYLSSFRFFAQSNFMPLFVAITIITTLKLSKSIRYK